MPNHFIETNLIIGYTVDWDRQAPVVDTYLDSITGTDLYTSRRVLTEAEDVVNKRRRLAKQAARRIFQDFDTSHSQPKINDIIKFITRELNHCSDSAVDHVIQHINDNNYYYTGLTQVDNRKVLERTNGDIDEDFEGALKIIRELRDSESNGLDIFVFNNIKNNYKENESFSTINQLLSGNDRDILFDSNRLAQEKDINLLYFVTIDSDFLDNKSDIESCLGKINIEHPKSV